VLGWLAGIGTELLDGARLRSDFYVFDIASGNGEPALSAAAWLTGPVPLRRGRLHGRGLSRCRPEERDREGGRRAGGKTRFNGSAIVVCGEK
jgi:hypothetical protein